MQIENAVEIGVRGDNQLVDVFDAVGEVLSGVLLRLRVEEFAANEERSFCFRSQRTTHRKFENHLTTCAVMSLLKRTSGKKTLSADELG